MQMQRPASVLTTPFIFSIIIECTTASLSDRAPYSFELSSEVLEYGIGHPYTWHRASMIYFGRLPV